MIKKMRLSGIDPIRDLEQAFPVKLQIPDWLIIIPHKNDDDADIHKPNINYDTSRISIEEK